MSFPKDRLFQMRPVALLGIAFFFCVATFLWLCDGAGVQNAPRACERLRAFLKICTAVGGGVGVYALIRLLMAHARPATQTQPAPPSSDQFMTQTLGDVIQALKHKEREVSALRKVAEERARRIESYNDHILQSVTSGVATFDLENRVTTLNAAAGSILNVSPEQAIGQSHVAIFGHDPAVARMLAAPRAGHRQECRIRRADGETVWLGMTASALRDGHQQVIGATVIFTDLTEIKRLQDQVEMKKHLALMGEMSAWVAHEFRNYMGTIFGFSKILSKQVGAEHPGQESVVAIHKEIVDMERLITEMLAYAKTHAIQPITVSLDALLRAWISPFSQGAPGIQWHTTLDAVQTALDPVLIRQVFGNLIQNAIEAMRGEGALSITLRRTPEGTAQACIADTGPGIADGDLERIFLPFVTTKEKGTGLGLALARKIILAHNGRITAGNRPEGGALFTVDLPV